MHSEHNTKMSLTNICGYCLAYIGTSHQDFTWKQWFVSGIAFTEHRGFILSWLPVERQCEIHGNECSALSESHLRCRPCPQCHCFAENFFLLCPWCLSWWCAMNRNSSLGGSFPLLPLAVPFPCQTLVIPSSCSVTRRPGRNKVIFQAVISTGWWFDPLPVLSWPVTCWIFSVKGIKGVSVSVCSQNGVGKFNP